MIIEAYYPNIGALLDIMLLYNIKCIPHEINLKFITQKSNTQQ